MFGSVTRRDVAGVGIGAVLGYPIALGCFKLVKGAVRILREAKEEVDQDHLDSGEQEPSAPRSIKKANN